MITPDLLADACSRGGANVLTSVTRLEPAAGKHASVSPAKFVDRRGSVFAFETRYIDGSPQRVVIMDSKQSMLNRGEAILSRDIEEGNDTLAKMPRMRVRYPNGETFTDLDLPHRFADGHFRAATINGQPATQDPAYRAVRDTTPGDITPLVNTAPASAVFGVWDATRAQSQVRLPSIVTGEIIGVLADQEHDGEEQQSRRGGARVDPLAMSVQLTPVQMRALLDGQRSELSPGNATKIEDQIKKAKKGQRISASPLGLGGIPPQLDSLGGVSCRDIIRSWVVSFAGLRQLRFGGNAEQDVAGRALLAALGLSAIARAEEELYLRANCHLVEAGAPIVTLDKRFGESETLEPLTVGATDKLLAETLAVAQAAGVVDWHGQVLEFEGNPDILGGAVDEAEE
ncbi:type I-U CRISPR-associated RAMP protein Csb1/Cas7u [Corynebacterium sp. LK2510]|uniref:type I-G CRISPR-associated RAMP protein Csb1/Cas7g n=1 Tax=Corynebacterium sp. LK2510 TaxID=3110472 RepID=UPI0034CED25C